MESDPTSSARSSIPYDSDEFIEANAKTNKFAYCKLCHREFSVAHGGHNDAKRHCASQCRTSKDVQ